MMATQGRQEWSVSIRSARCAWLLAALVAAGAASCAAPPASPDAHRPFTVAMLPDTQVYSKSHPDLFYAQTRWIRENREKENIVFVTHMGDIVNDRSKIASQWEVASKAMAMLDDVVPWGVAIGNHDFDGAADKSKATAFLQHFGPQRFARFPWYGGAAPNGLSSCQFFSGGGVDFVIFHLEADIPDAAIEWARGVLKKHPDRAAIVSTHIYLRGRDGIGRETQPAYNKSGNSGEKIWDRLVRGSPQIFMVLCGHQGRTDEYYQISTNDAGGRVLEILADYQKRARGGDGWLRLIRFVPERREIQVRTYSPVLDRFETDATSEFTLPWDVPAARCAGRGTAGGARHP